MTDLTERIQWMRDGESFFLSSLDRVGDDELGERSLLPGWTRSHVVSHVARNADALGNLLSWADTGLENPMYANAEQRDADIAAGAARPAGEVRDDAHVTSRRLMAATSALPASAWSFEVRTARGRAVPASEVPWMRCRETWIHGVDLDSGASFSDIPKPVVDALLDDVAAGFGGRDDCPTVELRSTSTDRGWRIGGSSNGVTVTGSSGDLLGWLLGRTSGEGVAAPGGAELPTVPRWL